jgi:hypothetical protein
MALNNMFPVRANGTIAPAVFVKMDTSADAMALQSTAGARIIGISQPGMKRAPGLPGSDITIAAQQGDQIMIFGVGDVCLLTAGASFTRGDLLKSDGSGFGLTASADGDNYGAFAIESASGINVLVRVQVLIGMRGA